MLPFTKGKENCTGCTACYSICPIKCIDMKQDEEGFLYPVASNACIDCGKCERVCPIINGLEGNMTTNPIAFAAISKDKGIWQRSASGGAFSEICRAWDDGDTVYAGAVFDGLYVHHKCVNGFSNIAPLCKSKYVESNLGDSFLTIKKHLDEGKRALLSGTPCQIAGLRQYLGKDYDNLLLIDLICHGVGSPKVFETCIKVTGCQFGVNITDYQFRTKRKVFETDHLQRITFDKHRYFYLEADPYIQLFLSQHCLRPSCGKNCRYRNENRQGDITIADFKGLRNVFPDLAGEKRNYSTIVFNNNKSKLLIPLIKKTMSLYNCSISQVKKYNPLYYRQTEFSNERELFFSEYLVSHEDTVERWTKPAKLHKTKLKHLLWNALPVHIRKSVINNVLKNK